MDNQLKNLLQFLGVMFVAIILLLFVMKAQWLAWVSYWDYVTQKMPAIVANSEVIWTEKMEAERIAQERAKVVKTTKVTPKVEKKQEKPKEVKIDTKPDFDLDRLARAVAMAETNNCTKGYGKTYNNCFGIKNGNTAPCPKIGKSKMCIYEKPEDSYEAFKKIWSKWYKTHPNLVSAQRWTGHDNAVRWLSHVNLHYNKL